MGRMIDFGRPGGGSARGWLAEAPSPRAGVVVIQEWWGLNAQIEGVAERFAAAGYTALAPDLYHGRVTSEPDEANHLMTGLDWVGATEEEVLGALQYLRGLAAKTVVLGFCMGGALAVIAAARLTELDAAVCYYGIPPAEAADPAAIRVPFLGHFATEDDWCTPAPSGRKSRMLMLVVDDHPLVCSALEATLKGAGVDCELYRYQAAHAFFNETSPAHDAAAAASSWQRTLDFLSRKL